MVRIQNLILIVWDKEADMKTRTNDKTKRPRIRPAGSVNRTKKSGRPPGKNINGVNKRKRRIRRLIVFMAQQLILIAALTILLSHMALPVFQIYGGNMEPTLWDGDYIAAVKGRAVKRNDIIAFYYNNKVLVKRVIALGGDIVDMAEDGTVSVNGEVQDEPFLNDKDTGISDIEMPYKVPAKHVFVMGDNRTDSIDSRASMIGPAGMEQVIGKTVLRLWPLNRFGFL